MEYPINLRLSGRGCAVVGGGAVAERKVDGLLKSRAHVTVIAPDLTAKLRKLAGDAGIIWHEKHYNSGDLQGFFLVVCATDDRAVNVLAAAEARKAGALVNVVDVPELCDFTLPGQVIRGDLLITVSTGGKSPAFARRMREEMERLYGPEYGDFLEFLGQAREDVKNRLTNSRDRETFWRQAINREVLALLRQGKLNEAEEKLQHAIGCLGTQS
jgi:precorrin-2 dehydrogenase/sirohydrochlorin ferrochelatase